MSFECWFCGQRIDRSDVGALMITLESLWRWANETWSDDDPAQSLFAHPHCAKSSLQGLTTEIDLSIFDEED